MDLDSFKKFLQKDGVAEIIFNTPFRFHLDQLYNEWMEKNEPETLLKQQEEELRNQMNILTSKIQDNQEQLQTAVSVRLQKEGLKDDAGTGLAVNQ